MESASAKPENYFGGRGTTKPTVDSDVKMVLTIKLKANLRINDKLTLKFTNGILAEIEE